MPRFALQLAYDGSGFAGLWRHPDQRTVSGTLIAACERFGERIADPIPVSRTDSGVHARANVVSIDLARDWDARDLLQTLEHHLADDLACIRCAPVAEDWDARSARAKTYRYTLDRSLPRDPLRASFAWRAPEVDVAVLGSLAERLHGSWPSDGFRKRGDDNEDREITVSRASWHGDEEGLHFTVTANRFTYRLVRTLVGAQVAIANGQRPVDDWSTALLGVPTPAAGEVAPARGLCLMAVDYDPAPAWIE